MSQISNHPQATIIWLAFILLAIGYSLVTPPLEAGDESRHYAVVKYMADTGRLPVQEPGEAQIHWSHEGNQPPLYYALAALLTFWIDTGSWDDVFWYNPHTTIGDPLRPDNKNITIHPPGEDWPWRGHVLAVHLIRFLSIAMAAVTIVACYAIALSLFRGNRWLAAGAMAITAFNPMFIFISSAVNNDNAVIMFVTLALWLMVRICESANLRITTDKAQSPITDHHSPFLIRHSPLLLGLLIGLGALSKLYALGLLPLAGLLFVWVAYQRDCRLPTADRQKGITSRPQETFDSALRTRAEDPLVAHHAPRIIFQASIWTLTTLAVALLVAGWFYVRNALLYQGDVLALQAMRETAGQRREMPTLATLRVEFEGFRIAYWALFGGVNILADRWIYQTLDWVSLAAVLGLIAFTIRFTIFDFRFRSARLRRIYDLRFTHHAAKGTQSARTTHHASPSSFVLLLGWSAIMIAGFIVWNLTQPAGQGRLLYPAIAAISALGMLGLTWWLPSPIQKWVAISCILGLFLFALASPFLYIAPAYAKPSILTERDLPSDLQPVNFTYGGAMRLLGYQLLVDTVHPAEKLPLILYWQILKPTPLNYSVFVHLLGRQRQVVGQVDTYPGGGHWPTTLLPPGAILADHYAVPIPPEAEFSQAPTRLLIATGIYSYNEPGRPGRVALNSAGQPVEPIIAGAKLIPWQWPNPPRLDSPITFGDQITLLSFQLAADQSSVTLNWQANAAPGTDYTVFLQLWSNSKQVRGFDGPPAQNDYPTSLWRPGEIIIDTHPLNFSALPLGDYELLAGLYNPTTGDRLPAFAAGQPLPNYAVNLGQIHIAANR